MTLLGYLDLTVVALVLFIHVERPMNKGAVTVAWGAGTTALTFGFI